MKKYVLISVAIAGVGILLVIGIALIALRSSASLYQETESTQAVSENDFKTLVLHGVEIKAEVADTPSERNKGLSGRATLDDGNGMLFIFPKSDKQSFWMPDMRFAIDIIWLDEYMKVVHIKESATPESYPEKFTTSVPAKYVLEVPAGFSKEKGIVVGDQAVVR